MNPPFNMIIVGMTACGKTQYLLEMLEEEYLGVFDYVVLVCPTFSWNKSYTEWLPSKKDDCFVPIDCEQEQVNKVLKIISALYAGTSTLIVLDDCASGTDVKNRTSEFVRLAFSARHYGLSVIVITQQLTSIAKPFRENISKLVAFYNTNRKDMETLMDDYIGDATKEEKKQIVENLQRNKHARLEIELRHPFTHKLVKPNIKL